MHSVELRNLAEHLRRHPEHAERVADRMDALAAEAAEAEALPVPAEQRFADRPLRLAAGRA